MTLRMIRCGMLAGMGFLLALRVLDALTPPVGTAPARMRSSMDDEVDDQRWAVLAEARRILEESNGV